MSAGKIVITDRISMIDLQNLSIKTINFLYLIVYSYHCNDIDRFVDQFMRGMWCIKIDEASSGYFYSLKS
ncbi:Uncharacterised protein [Klebsiella michiganensis]|uniref:Uncharacterized protein n=1 Tax=Klebsiella michiganensis TaxID=1134687 RepID=A0A7H4M166_9ENTR|nr:Uncharacterised protein [Klebsiella michiganensis]